MGASNEFQKKNKVTSNESTSMNFHTIQAIYGS